MKVYNPVKSLLKSEYFEKAYSTKRIMYFSVSKVLVPPMRRWRGWFTKEAQAVVEIFLQDLDITSSLLAIL